MTFVHQSIPGTGPAGALQAMGQYLNPRGSAYAAWLFGNGVGATPGGDLTGRGRNVALAGGTQGAYSYIVNPAAPLLTSIYCNGLAVVSGNKITLWAIYKASQAHASAVFGNWNGTFLPGLLLSENPGAIAYNVTSVSTGLSLGRDPTMDTAWALSIFSATPTTMQLYKARTGLRQFATKASPTGTFGGDQALRFGRTADGNFASSDPELFAAGVCTDVFTEAECDRSFRMMRQVMAGFGQVL